MYIYTYIHLCMYIYTYLSNLSIYLTIYLSTYLPIYLSTYLPIYLSIYLQERTLGVEVVSLFCLMDQCPHRREGRGSMYGSGNAVEEFGDWTLLKCSDSGGRWCYQQGMPEGPEGPQLLPGVQVSTTTSWWRSRCLVWQETQFKGGDKGAGYTGTSAAKTTQTARYKFHILITAWNALLVCECTAFFYRIPWIFTDFLSFSFSGNLVIKHGWKIHHVVPWFSPYIYICIYICIYIYL